MKATPWLFVLALGAGAYWWWSKLTPGGHLVMPTPSPKPAPPPSPNGALFTTPGGNGSLNVTLTPGAMGILKIASGFSAPELNIAAPPGGLLSALQSTNENVVSTGPDGAIVGNVSALTVGTGMVPGTGTLTVDWHDSSGSAQTSSFTVQAS